jgi:hypothetical protein
VRSLIWCAAGSFTAFSVLLITATVLYGDALPLAWNIALGGSLGLAVIEGTVALAWHLTRRA